jgi:hypothetical protein
VVQARRVLDPQVQVRQLASGSCEASLGGWQASLARFHP